MIDNPRVDLVIAKYGRGLAVAAVVVGALALVATGWAVATPETKTTTQHLGNERVQTDVHTSAVVVRDGLWEEGTTLENSPVYTRADTPEVTLEPRTAVPTDGASVDHVVEIRFAAARNGNVFWEEREEVLNASATVEDGVASSRVTIDVDALAERIAEIEDRLDGVGSLDVTVHVDARYDTGTNAGHHELASALGIDERAYWLEEELSESELHPQTVEREVTEPVSSSFVGGMLVLALLSFGAAAFVRVRSPVDTDAARRAVHERRYAEWISHGTIPMWIGDHHVSLDTLEDVVDVAIDTNERVVHDRQRGLFAVVSDDVVYYYSERGFWEETAWPDIDLEQGEASTGTGDDEGTIEPPTDLPDPDDDDAWQQL